jgi:endonuclease IV
MLGYHVNKQKRSLPRAIAEEMAAMSDSGIAAPCCQVFVRGPQSYAASCSDAEAAEIGTRYSGQVVVHGAYTDYMNGGAPAIGNIRAELATCELMRAIGLVVHLGNEVSVEETLRPAMAATTIPVYLEINAGKRRPSWADPVRLATLFGQLSDLNLGLCVDTQHIWADGVAVSTAAEYQSWHGELTAAFAGQLPPIMYHVNDSAVPFDSGVDRHAEITHGSIWRNYNAGVAAELGLRPSVHFSSSGCAEIVRSARQAAAPVIFESKDPRGLLRVLPLYGLI